MALTDPSLLHLQIVGPGVKLDARPGRLGFEPQNGKLSSEIPAPLERILQDRVDRPHRNPGQACDLCRRHIPGGPNQRKEND
jgi:hypothetical protein